MRPIVEVADELPEELRDIGLDGLLEEEAPQEVQKSEHSEKSISEQMEVEQDYNEPAP